MAHERGSSRARRADAMGDRPHVARVAIMDGWIGHGGIQYAIRGRVFSLSANARKASRTESMHTQMGT